MCLRCFLCISRPLPNKTKLKFDQNFKPCRCFCFELKVLNESKCWMPGVRCACGNVLFSSLHNHTKLMRLKIKFFHSHLILAASIWYLMCAKYEVLSILIVPGLRSVQDQNALHKTQQWLFFSFNNIRHNDEIELHCLILIWYWGVGTYGGVEIPPCSHR